MIGITGLLYNSADKLHTRGYVSSCLFVSWLVGLSKNNRTDFQETWMEDGFLILGFGFAEISVTID